MEDADKMSRKREARQGILATVMSRNAFGEDTMAEIGRVGI
ncbi:hypothetical protein [Octadecabacter temperatus]|nr:hypothetical protein [Octadecabacter temperatus]